MLDDAAADLIVKAADDRLDLLRAEAFEPVGSEADQFQLSANRPVARRSAAGSEEAREIGRRVDCLGRRNRCGRKDELKWHGSLSKQSPAQS
jgi:hypothetical protein